MNTQLFRFFFCILLLLVLSTGCSNTNGTKKTNAKEEKTVELTISAAASLQDALQDIQKQYEKSNSNIKLSFNFGGSGALQQQIEQGAPADLFFSAAEDKFQTLVEKGFIDQKEAKNLLGNELVLIVPKNSSIHDLQALKSAQATKIAIGTPESVPAGQYAKESLIHLHVWDAVQHKLIYTKDVRQVLTYVETNNVEAGIVYKTDALISEKVKIASTIQSDAHEPIHYPLGVIKNTKHKKEATAFYQYLQSKEATAIFQKHGFKVLPQ
ncbi:molybdenum ABC transporter substrate-binding protein [Bacillus manliponensis]|uniref:Molybdenum ABC transporter substrate-binding protein n=1 Tax=Bacillus manliponensis TaxID=574376 RepID=A0A073JUR0_9BACI|nr:molybdate ABC transporter substrate-binding protein [Bacillus manliponensis]KEK18035.1 molybdenum ABC transporter substrate-binding protein [Bacillus manliponensis]